MGDAGLSLLTDADEVWPRTHIGTPPSSERGEDPAPPPPDSAESSPRLHPVQKKY